MNEIIETEQVDDISTSLRGFIGSKKKITIERCFANDEYTNGFVHDVSEQLAVIQHLHEFTLDGYSIIRIENIVDYEYGEHEQFVEKILQSEGIMDRVQYKRSIPIADFKDVLSYFEHSKENISVECESEEDSDDDIMYIGKVLTVRKDMIIFKEFNVFGEWLEEVEISIDEITKVEFDTPYINIFSRYTEAE